MTYPVTHILIAIIFVELFRKNYLKNNEEFPKYYVLIAAIGGILPDLDIGLFYILYFFGYTIEQIHRTFLHSIFIPIMLVFIGIFISKLKFKDLEIKKEYSNISAMLFILSIGNFIHLMLDLITGTATLFYPFNNMIVGLGIFEKLPSIFEELILPSLDGILLIFWLFWMEFKLKIIRYF